MLACQLVANDEHREDKGGEGKITQFLPTPLQQQSGEEIHLRCDDELCTAQWGMVSNPTVTAQTIQLQ